MTISKVYIEFHKITSFGRSWKAAGDPWEVLGGASGGPWGIAGGSLGVVGGLRELLGILPNSTRKCHKDHILDHENDDGKVDDI